MKKSLFFVGILLTFAISNCKSITSVAEGSTVDKPYASVFHWKFFGLSRGYIAQCNNTGSTLSCVETKVELK